MEKNHFNLRSKIELYSTRVIYYALIVIPFVAGFSSALVNLGIGLSIFSYLLKKISKKEFFFQKNNISLPFSLMLLFSIVTFANSVSLEASIQGIGKLIYYGFLFTILSEEVKDVRHLKRIAIALISGVLLASADGIYQLLFGVDIFRQRPYDVAIGLPRLKAAFSHTNLFAAYLALFLPFSWALTRYYLKGKTRTIFAAIALIAFFCLIFTFSRGAILGFFLTVLVMALIKKDKLVLGILILSLLVSPFLLPKNIKDWIGTTDSIWEVLLNKERLNIYKTSLNMIKSHPFLGVGVNTYCLNYQKYKIHETSGFTGNAMYYAHNIYLHMAGETGLIGLGIFLWLLFVLFKSWATFFFKNKGTLLLRIFSLGLIAGITAFLFNGLTETNLYYPKIATLFWYEVGLLLGIYNLERKTQYKI